MEVQEVSRPAPISSRHAIVLLGLILASTIVGLAGTDLVLPAIPQLSEQLPGSAVQAQLVLASFVAGSGIGILLFGEMGARWDQRKLLVMAMALYAVVSAAAPLVNNLSQLIAIRFLQGLASSAAAVFAPGMIRAVLPENQAIRAIGTMGSVESLTPALAPIVGAWLLTWFDWRGSFILVAAVSLALCLAWSQAFRWLPANPPLPKQHHYGSLLLNRSFLGQGLSQAGTLGALLIFVFAAPALFAGPMGGSIRDFVIMQVIGVSFFIAAASSAHWWVLRVGRETMVWVGTAISFTGASGLLVYGVMIHIQVAQPAAWVIWAWFILVNMGLGVRGPPGFFAAMEAAGEDSARAAAIIILLVMLVAAAGTAAVAPVIAFGLLPVAAMVSAVSGSALLCYGWAQRA